MWPRQYGRRETGPEVVRLQGPDEIRCCHGLVRDVLCLIADITFSSDVLWRNCLVTPDRSASAADRGGQASWLLGPVGCGDRSPCTPGLSTWSSSRSLRTYSAGNLVLEGASRLDAFSAYPVPTWLPDDALSRTAGTPEVGPPQSSRTRGDAPQVSHAHGR